MYSSTIGLSDSRGTFLDGAISSEFFAIISDIIPKIFQSSAAKSSDWLFQAERDLEQAEDSRLAKRHEWACFAAHQSAEKAAMALHLSFGQEAWGHVVARLLRELPDDIDVSDELVEKAKVLDN